MTHGKRQRARNRERKVYASVNEEFIKRPKLTWWQKVKQWFTKLIS